MLVPQDGGKDRVLGEVKSYNHSLRSQPPKYPSRLAADVFVRDTSSLRHQCVLFKLRLVRMQPPAFHSASPGNMHYAHVSVASVEADRPDYVRTSRPLSHLYTYIHDKD